MAFNIETSFNEINKGDIIISHKGIITTELITKLLNDFEQELIKRNEKSKLRKTIYNILVESLQNLFHHTDNLPDDDYDSTTEKYVSFVLKKEKEGKYSYISGNYILKNRVKFLKDRIDQINSLTHNELKLLYKLILNNNEFSDKGGGGLGLVDIAKRTKNKYEYEFHDVMKEYSFYCLKIIITY